MSSWPIAQLPTGWSAVLTAVRTQASISSGVCTSAPGITSPCSTSLSDSWAKISRNCGISRRKKARSFSVESTLERMRGLSAGSAERSFTHPRPSGRSSTQAMAHTSILGARQPGNQSCAPIMVGWNRHCASGRSSSGRVLMKPLAVTGMSAIIPPRVSSHCSPAKAARSSRRLLVSVTDRAARSTIATEG